MTRAVETPTASAASIGSPELPARETALGRVFVLEVGTTHPLKGGRGVREVAGDGLIIPPVRRPPLYEV